MLSPNGRLADLTLVVVVATCSLAAFLQLVQSQSLLGSASCDDLRGPDNQIICNRQAYRAWLAAGRADSTMPKECYHALVTLPDKCNMTQYLEDALRVSEEQVDPSGLLALRQYVDKGFIEVYQATHSDEPALHLGIRENGDNCCLSDEGITGRDGFKTQQHLSFDLGIMRDQFQKGLVSREQLFEAVENSLYKLYILPCHLYWQTMNELLFGQLENAVVKLMDDNWSFLANQSEEFRHAVFRYQWCYKLELDKDLKHKKSANKAN